MEYKIVSHPLTTPWKLTGNDREAEFLCELRYPPAEPVKARVPVRGFKFPPPVRPLEVKGNKLPPAEILRLEKDHFQVIRKDTGPVIEAGEDVSRHCLLLVSCIGGKNGIAIKQAETTGDVLKISLSNRREYRPIAVVALLRAHQTLVVESWNPRGATDFIYRWDGTELLVPEQHTVHE